MRTKTLVIGYVLALALLLFAQRHHNAAEAAGLRTVIDLTYPVDPQSVGATSRFLQVAYTKDGVGSETSETWMAAPAQISRALWTMDEIPPARLISSLVVFDERENVKRIPDYQVTVPDIANWERNHGEIPLGAVVMLLTGRTADMSRKQTANFPGFSAEATTFLIEGRDAIGLGTDLAQIPADRLPASSQYALSHSSYLLYKVANLDHAPATGGMVMVAPVPTKGRISGPVRILALAK